MKTAVAMAKFVLTGLTALILLCLQVKGQDFVVLKKHDPRKDSNLNPFVNYSINPDSNSIINPAYNWNNNPLHTNEVNPLTNASINPMNNTSLNPQVNDVLNPVRMRSLLPASPTWNGL
jgi:hypothetical protein